ncbi:Uncharacterised protein [Legionella beliardensis]|uniref:Uncharacterized protein n=1 Tax=Legionella beliardensis TaxID=91822 RepID=A0A378I3I0_9GAMM|nr:Uncharacterised protein [Legionella beliardensis]
MLSTGIMLLLEMDLRLRGDDNKKSPRKLQFNAVIPVQTGIYT